MGDTPSNLARALQPYDDDALTALSNRGVVKRARKDLERQPPSLTNPGPPARLQVEDATVTLGESPQSWQCSCRAPLCRHVLSAVMYLRTQLTESASPAPPAADNALPELLALSTDDIARWSGKAVFQRALKLAGGDLDVRDGPPLVLRLPARNVECRWLAGRGLDAMLCSCHAAGPCEHKVAAILALHLRHHQTALPQPRALTESTGSPRTREQVRAAVLQSLREMMSVGLSRISSTMQDRLRTLAVSAHGVDLPRLAQLLRTLAAELALRLTRDAQSDTLNLMTIASTCAALATALQRPSPALVGTHRTTYEPLAGELQLIGAGARRWRTRSGYAGLTVYFWDRVGRWCSWSEARPHGTPGFDPLTRYADEGPWAGCANPKQAGRHTWRLSSAWRNSAGRLSGRPGARAVRVGKTDISEIPAITRWSDLAPVIERLWPGGLAERNEHDAVVMLAPHQFGSPTFDPVRQAMIWPIADPAGRTLPLVLPHAPETDDGITAIERLQPGAVQRILGLAELHTGSVEIQPITLFGHDTINLTLDPAPIISSTVPAAANAQDLEEPAEGDETIDVSTASSLGQLLASLRTELGDIADAGLLVVNPMDRIQSLAHELDGAGLHSVAQAVTRWIAAAEQFRRTTQSDPSPAADALLAAFYLAQLAAEQELVALARAEIE